MLAFDPKNRIPTKALFQQLTSVTQYLKHQVKLNPHLKNYKNILKPMNYYWRLNH